MKSGNGGGGGGRIGTAVDEKMKGRVVDREERIQVHFQVYIQQYQQSYW